MIHRGGELTPTPEGSTLYVVCDFGGSIMPIDLLTNDSGREIVAGGHVSGMVIVGPRDEPPTPTPPAHPPAPVSAGPRFTG